MEGIRTTRIVGIPCLDLDDLANDIAGHQIFDGIEDRFYPSSGVAVIDRVETYHTHICSDSDQVSRRLLSRQELMQARRV